MRSLTGGNDAETEKQRFINSSIGKGRKRRGVGMLKGKKIILRPVNVDSDVERSAGWMNDGEVVGFLGNPLKPVTKEKERESLEKMLKDESRVTFAIDTFCGRHIGFIGLGKISHFHGTAETGTMIGDKNFWSAGYGTDAKMVLLHYAFTVLNLRRIESHVLSFNKRSLKCQLKCGYRIEGVLKKKIYKNGKYHDLVLLAVFRDGWFKFWKRYQKKSG